jgi:hypothetical protein
VPRFFFYIRDGYDVVDDEGTELPGLDEAPRQVITGAGEMLRDKGREFWGGTEWVMEVRVEQVIERASSDSPLSRTRSSGSLSRNPAHSSQVRHRLAKSADPPRATAEQRCEDVGTHQPYLRIELPQ